MLPTTLDQDISAVYLLELGERSREHAENIPN